MTQKVPNEAKANIYAAAVQSYGITHQLGKLTEELGELQIEVGKILQGDPNLGHLAEEVADVTILLEQVKAHYGIEGLCGEFVDYKTARLRDKIVNRKLAEEMMD